MCYVIPTTTIESPLQSFPLLWILFSLRLVGLTDLLWPWDDHRIQFFQSLASCVNVWLAFLHMVWFCVLFVVCFVLWQFPVSLASLELAMETRLPLNSREIHLRAIQPQSAGMKGVHHNARLACSVFWAAPMWMWIPCFYLHCPGFHSVIVCIARLPLHHASTDNISWGQCGHFCKECI